MRSILLKSVSSLAVVVSLHAGAAPVLFTGSSGSLAATVSFDIVGSQLQVVLSNTATGDVLVPTDVLTAVFFNITGNPLLTRSSAISGGPTYLGSTNVSGAGTAIGGEWTYLNGLSQYSANSGISSSGLGIFGPGDRFPGLNLAGPESPNGLEYGLASAGDNPATGNAGILDEELTKSSVSFLLTTSSPFDLSAISNVTFQYGSALSEGHFSGTRPRIGARAGNAWPCRTGVAGNCRNPSAPSIDHSLTDWPTARPDRPASGVGRSDSIACSQLGVGRVGPIRIKKGAKRAKAG
jgi:hypothetical protein